MQLLDAVAALKENKVRYIIFLIGCFFVMNVDANTKFFDCNLDVGALLAEIEADPDYFEGMPKQLLHTKSFVLLKVCAPKRHLEYMEFVLRNPKHPTVDALILALQTLKGDKYVKFLNEMIKAAKNKVINQDQLYKVAFPGYDWNTYLVENYDVKTVQVLIKDLAKLLPERKAYFEDIASGVELDELIMSRLNQHTTLNNI